MDDQPYCDNKRKRDSDSCDGENMNFRLLTSGHGQELNMPRDPNLDLEVLFKKFNDLYFNSKLTNVTIKWDCKATAGGRLLYAEEEDLRCVIKLSEPLLHTNQDIYEVLLHLMIHASLYFDYASKLLEENKGLERIDGIQLTREQQDHERHRTKHEWNCMYYNLSSHGSDFLRLLKDTKSKSGYHIPLTKGSYIINPKNSRPELEMVNSEKKKKRASPEDEWLSVNATVQTIGDECFMISSVVLEDLCN